MVTTAWGEWPEKLSFLDFDVLQLRQQDCLSASARTLNQKFNFKFKKGKEGIVIGKNPAVDSDLFFQSQIGLFIYVFVLPVCLFTCCCTWNHMFRVAACAKDHSAFRLCWNAGVPDYSLWLSRAAFVISVFPVLGENKWVYLPKTAVGQALWILR